MKYSIIIALFLSVGLGSCHSSKQDSEAVSEMTSGDILDIDTPRNPYASPLFDQYFEILRSSEGDIQTLDAILGIVNLFMTQYWAYPKDSVKFKMKMGLDIDEDYPNGLVRKTVFEYLNNYLARGFEYDITSDKQHELISRGRIHA